MFRLLMQLLIPMLAGRANETTQGPFANPFGSPMPQTGEDEDPLDVDAEVVSEDGTVEGAHLREEWDRRVANATRALSGEATPTWRMPVPKCGALPIVAMLVIAIACGVAAGLVLGLNPAVCVALGVMLYALADDLRSRCVYAPLYLVLIVAAIAARVISLYNGAVFTSVVVPGVVGIIAALLVSIVLLFFIERRQTRDTFFAKELDVLALIAVSVFAGWNWLIFGLVAIIVCALVSRLANKKLPFTALLMALGIVQFLAIGFAGV